MIEPRKQINNIYGYVRVSTVQQAKDGSSLEDQQKKIEEFVQAKFNRPVDKFFIDAGVSGAKPLTDFLPADNLLRMCEALVRVFDKYGDKKNRNK